MQKMIFFFLILVIANITQASTNFLNSIVFYNVNLNNFNVAETVAYLNSSLAVMNSSQICIELSFEMPVVCNLDNNKVDAIGLNVTSNYYNSIKTAIERKEYPFQKHIASLNSPRISCFELLKLISDFFGLTLEVSPNKGQFVLHPRKLYIRKYVIADKSLLESFAENTKETLLLFVKDMPKSDSLYAEIRKNDLWLITTKCVHYDLEIGLHNGILIWKLD